MLVQKHAGADGPALAALGLHLMPRAVVRAAPRMLSALAGVVHSRKGAPDCYERQRCHYNSYGGLHFPA